MTAYSQVLKPGDTLDVVVAAATPPPVDPPPVEPPPNSIEVVPALWSQKYLDALKDGTTVLLHGGEYNTPFLIVRRKVTLQNFPGEVPVLTCGGRPDILYHETDGVVRGLTIRSQSTGFDDSQGAALLEVRSPTVPIGLVWYDNVNLVGTSKMSTREQFLYMRDMGRAIAEVRVTGGDWDGAGTQGYGTHPYSGPSPNALTIDGTTFRNFPRNAAVSNWAGKCLCKVDHATFVNTVTYARGQYGPVNVSNSKLSGNAIGTVIDKGGNT